jgi:glycosyltransferase involved in cell wall biosynthesis
MLAGSARPRALVHTFHGHVLTGYFDPARERLFCAIERALARRTHALIAVSSQVRDDLVRLRIAPAEKIVVVQYGFDLDRRVRRSPEARARGRERLHVDGAEFVVGWAGRLTAIKRPLDLVRAIAGLEGGLLAIAGDGEQRAETEALARALGVANRVRFLGHVDDVGSWYHALDAFLLTSANEGTPVAVIEALAAGVPVAATDAGGTRTVVDDGETGFLAAVGDVAALARHLERLRDEPALRTRLGELGARRMRERFSTERMVDEVERVYARAGAA